MPGNQKIAFVINGLGIGGAERFLINVVNHFYKNGYEPLVILLSKENKLLHELDNRIKVVTILKKARLDIFVTNRIKSAINSEEINKVFCVNAYPFFLTKLSYLFNRKKKFFLSLHTTLPFSNKYYWENLIYFRLISKQDTIIYLCNNQKEYVKAKYYLSNTSDRVVYNGIDTAYFNPDLYKDLDIAGLKQQYNLNSQDKVIIQVARLQAEKRHFDAIDALGILHQQYNNKAHLLLVGSGKLDYTESLQQYVKKKGLEAFVHFAGSHTDVRKFYCISDVFTLTSNSETFSLAALEAMAFCLPCSLTDIGGAREMTIEGVTGVLSKPEDALSIANSWNKILTSNLKGEHIRQYVLDNFTSEKMLKQYIDLVEGSHQFANIKMKLFSA